MVEVDAKPEEIAFFKNKCHAAINDIKWDPEAQLLPQLTTTTALSMARAGDNFRKSDVIKLEPQNTKYEEWMNFVHLLTILYNRNRKNKKYTILRNGCYK